MIAHAPALLEPLEQGVGARGQARSTVHRSATGTVQTQVSTYGMLRARIPPSDGRHLARHLCCV